jgi:hypothetical protein
MSRTSCLRWGVGAALLLAALPFLAGAGEKKPAAGKEGAYKGKVVPLADLVAKTGSRLDADAAPHWLALVAEDGTVYPLVKDSAARMFFKDERLRNRTVRLVAKPLPGSQVLRVLSARFLVRGEWCEAYYWCDVCSIRRGEKMVCECCGGPMELRVEPVKE